MTEGPGTAATTRKPCPICGKVASPAAEPFCSSRCADVDLHRWLSGSYALPVTETDVDEGDSVNDQPRD